MRAAWEKHPHFGGPASTLLAIHDQFRAASRRLREALAQRDDIDLRWAGMMFRPLATTLHHHHHAEELMLFPYVERRTGRAPSELVTDHASLTDAIAALERSLVAGADLATARAAAATFDDVLGAHLSREESLVIPVLLELPPAETWELVFSGSTTIR
jgi:hypothetical protein